MGIIPISSFIPISDTSFVKSELDPLPMERAEFSGRAGEDESYSPSGQSDGETQDEATGDEVLEVAADETTENLVFDDAAPIDEFSPGAVEGKGDRFVEHAESAGVNFFA